MIAAGLAFALGGCASKTKVTTAPDGAAKIVSQNEVRYVRVTGSNIPVAVPISPDVRPLPLANAIQTMSPEQFREVVQRGQH
jgi:hypothetical protein